MSIKTNLESIQNRVKAAAKGQDVKIIGVTKTVSVEKIQEAHDAGLRFFGENRVQEALPKMQSLSHLPIEWHFIGHLQSNKAKDAVRHFSCIQSVDSVKLLQQIERESAKLQKKMDVLLEMNVGGEESKYGFPTEKIQEALELGNSLSWIRITGFMIIPPFLEDPEQVRPHFRRTRELLERKRREFPALMELSMGMSHDYIVAIEEGATMVRIGTALFGERMI